MTGDSTTATEPTEAATRTVGTPSAALRGHVDDAVGRIEEAAATYAEEVAKLESSLDYVGFRTAPVETQLEVARADLERAESVSEAPLAGLDTLFAIVDWFELLVDALALYDGGLDVLQSAEVYAENDRDEAAARELDGAATAFQNAVSVVEEAGVGFEELDVDTLEGLVASTPEEVWGRLEEVSGLGDDVATYAGALTFYADGAREFLLGRERYDASIRAAEDGDVETSIVAIADATDHFEVAVETATAGEDVAPNPLLGGFLRLACRADRYAEAAGHFHTLVVALEDDEMAVAEDAAAAWNEAELRLEDC